MIEVNKNLFVGNDNDCAKVSTIKQPQWAIIHACKYKCYMDILEQQPSFTSANVASGNSQNNDDLFIETTNNLYLNLLDFNDSVTETSLTIIVAKVYKFINENINNSKVLIHCNYGIARSATMALLYLCRYGVINKLNYKLAMTDFNKLYPHYHPTPDIEAYCKANWQALMTLI